MSLHKLNQAELNQDCKKYIESVEIWLRRLIDQTLTIHYGSNYLTFQHANGDYLIKNEIRNKIQARIDSEPGRYPRPIDACLLEHEIAIISNPVLYKIHFKKVFENEFPEGLTGFRKCLDRLVQPRNKLYHANPISIREAERVICYSNDIIDAIKDYYIQTGMNQEYNRPLS